MPWVPPAERRNLAGHVSRRSARVSGPEIRHVRAGVIAVTSVAKPDVVDLLLAQHAEIRQLFADLRGGRGERKRELFQDLVRLLAVHESAEEELIHPLARRHIESGGALVDRRLAEEQEAKRALADMYEMGVEHPEFDDRLYVLGLAVIEHATHEEREEFPYLRRILEADELQKLAGAVRAAEALAPTRPHPATPPSATANLLLGPPLAVFDRIRDALRDTRERR
jgi:hemerythrin superfamily protein